MRHVIRPMLLVLFLAGMIWLAVGCGPKPTTNAPTPPTPPPVQTPTDTALETHFEKGVKFLGFGNKPQAMEEFAAAVKDEPEHGMAHYYLACLYSEIEPLSAKTRAYQEFKLVVSLMPQTNEANQSTAYIKKAEAADKEAARAPKPTATPKPASPAASTSPGVSTSGEFTTKLYTSSASSMAADRASFGRILQMMSRDIGSLQKPPPDAGNAIRSAQMAFNSGKLSEALRHLELAGNILGGAYQDVSGKAREYDSGTSKPSPEEIEGLYMDMERFYVMAVGANVAQGLLARMKGDAEQARAKFQAALQLQYYKGSPNSLANYTELSTIASTQIGQLEESGGR